MSDIENLTIGIEEEYQIIDPESRELTSFISEFLEKGAFLFRDQMKPEFLQSQVEISSKVCKNIVQCVFNCCSPHGDIYCTISKTLDCYNKNIPLLQHIVTLPNHNENMRKELNIPQNAVVFGGYGGSENFNIKYVQETKIIKHEIINKFSVTIFIGIINLNSPTATHKKFDM